jgi:uncharacterized protein
VKKEKEYSIPFKGLSSGNHHFTFKIDKKFFEGFEYFESETGKVKVALELIKESNLLDLHFYLDGYMNLICDRCLTEFKQPLEGNFRLIIKFGETFSEESDEVVVIPSTESTIDVKQYIFEYINLLLPIKRVHPSEDDCNPEMIKKLHGFERHESDPRWEALKNIKLE